MGKTMSEKILSLAAGRDVKVDDVVWAKASRVSLIDSSNFVRWVRFFDEHKARVWDAERVIISFDHFYRDLAGGIGSFPMIRRWAERQRIPKANVFDVGRHGISHQVPAEHGHVLPGTFYVAADTQGPTMGALNCFAVAVLDAVPYVLATGDMWLRVPPAIRIHFQGRLRKGVLGKDVCLALLRDLAGRAEGLVIEVTGPGVATLPIGVRMAIANGAPHMGAVTMIFEPDERLADYVRRAGAAHYTPVAPDDDASYVDTLEYDLGTFEHLVSGPDAPSAVQRLVEVAGIPVQAAYIGSCSSGRLEDLELAAEVLKDRHVHPDVRLVITPISSQVLQEAAERGLISIFTKAGATVTTPGCGACFQGNQSPLLLADGEVCITGSVENWPGRMGSPNAKIYLASAAIVAASAIAGRIADPERLHAS